MNIATLHVALSFLKYITPATGKGKWFCRDGSGKWFKATKYRQPVGAALPPCGLTEALDRQLARETVVFMPPWDAGRVDNAGPMAKEGV